MKYLLILVILLLSGCGTAYYPASANGPNPFSYQGNPFSTQPLYQPQSQNCSYLNGMLYCW